MKTLATILVMAIAITFTANAQGKMNKNNQNRPQLSVEQQTNLSLKKLNLMLDLTEKQQNELKPILLANATQRNAKREQMRNKRASGQKPSADEIYAMKSQQMDNQLAMKNNMKRILTKEQFEKFETMVAKQHANRNKRMFNNGGMNRGMQQNRGGK